MDTRITYERPRERSGSITLWNVLALLSALIGAAATLMADQLSLRAWASGGIAVPIGADADTGTNTGTQIHLPAGLTHIYYESYEALPQGNLVIRILDETGKAVYPDDVDEEVSYKLLVGGWSGRPMWTLDVPQTGWYSVTCYNHNYEQEDEVPATDRLAFAKKPDTLAQAKTFRRVIQITGATITVLLVVVFYVMHGIAMNKR
jgi:hypothetical protein